MVYTMLKYKNYSVAGPLSVEIENVIFTYTQHFNAL